ncbi:unnamed protein product [Vitrella brassicaformis CCMP3155]|uniref:Glycosyl hydrolase family 13 catalytic domain-containing protein n=1 Tax=Vitrella brassicaformis (strain CCMP3155) TaxID=1169540 RepID=A0A0G4EUD5_VITBC|nr:unnamed protein product [Vitrella brassicaformis CCMP3155]|eukprot:CEM01903.1 unnamed protein product [Vitrella brassicaformis CCMP3155]
MGETLSHHHQQREEGEGGGVAWRKGGGEIKLRWVDSIFHETNTDFVSNPYPSFLDTITLDLRFLKTDQVKTVFLRAILNGTAHHIRMHLVSDAIATTTVFSIYRCEFTFRQSRLSYHFVLETTEGLIFYTRRGVHKIHPPEAFNFLIMSDFEHPEWVPSAVFYQIFPDRFRKRKEGGLGVRQNEYDFDGHPALEMEWGSEPLEYKEGWCMDFYNGDLDGIRESIDYFKELGVNALYLNPIFAARTTHRYDCTDYFNVEPHIGGNDALARLIGDLHRAGMYLMLDVSINHTGLEHQWFKTACADPMSEEAGYYYRDVNGDYACWYGVKTLPQLNFGSHLLREKLIDPHNPHCLVKHWIRFGIDAWRFDVGSETGRRDSDQYTNDIWRAVRTAVKSEKRNAYIIGEHWEDYAEYCQGDQWDSSMNYFGCLRPLRRFAGEADHFTALLTSNGEAAPTSPAPTGTEVAEQILQNLLRLPNQLQWLQFNLMGSHDIHRFHNHPEAYQWDLYRGMIIAQFLLPGTPSIYYGDEIGIPGRLGSLEGCRYCMEWDRSKWNSEHYHLYRTLCYLKRSHKALHTGSFKILVADTHTCVMSRFLALKAFIGILNRSEYRRTIQIPGTLIGIADWKDVFETPSSRSGSKVFNGRDDGKKGRRGTIDADGMMRVTLEPFENTLLECNVRL